MVSTSLMVDTSSHPRAQLHRCVERSAYETAAGIYKKPIDEIAETSPYEPLPAEVRAAVLAACARGGRLPNGAVEHIVRLKIKEGAIQMSTKQVKPNQWYFVVECAKCGEAIPFLEAPSPEEEPNVKQRTIEDLKCPHCGYVGRYAPALMYRDQAPGK
ncbi:CpXC domain-containing protein [Bradyrhizobium sp. CCGUVB4N]|uniref:CpXC domain-containing protein n=1 Tax=Bradyrhizobium sp. CCGUVB4N TaxID=2949631 RepID=UPI0020B361B3|nr:CpXC domain-containing protein [Bradyrhizobium sp. CCGUVB4N]MCP3386011.1 CpXC domain-containing protein [Bradyrhizobium sp. CCGUVB4N]